MTNSTPSPGLSLRRPGQSIHDRGVWRALFPFLILLFLCGFVLGAAWRPAFFSEALAVAVLLGLGAGLLWAGKRAERILERHSRGAAGEERVAQALAALDADWRVFHAVSLDADNEADHVVIGPQGVFVIETINWQGRISVEDGAILDDGRAYHGYRLDEIVRRAESLRSRVSDPELPVTAVVCAAGGRLAPMPNPLQGVWFAETHSLLAILKRAGQTPVASAQRDALLRRLSLSS